MCQIKGHIQEFQVSIHSPHKSWTLTYSVWLKCKRQTLLFVVSVQIYLLFISVKML